MGLKDTTHNRSRAESVVQVMNQDLRNPYGEFDATLERYLLMLKPNISIHGKTTKLVGKRKVTIGDCWDDWLEIKRKKLSSSTFIATYQKKFGGYIEQFRGFDISEETAKKVSAFLSGINDKSAANKFINQLIQAVRLAVDKGELNHNPFSPYASMISLPKKTQELEDEENRKAFDLEDMETIIQAYRKDYNTLEYGQLTEFLFLTGCRPSEAFALVWDDIKINKYIKITKSLSRVTGEIKSTKTGESRVFSLRNNNRLNELLLGIERRGNFQSVFCSKGKRITHSNFTLKWSSEKYGIVRNLAETEQIKQYIKPYSTRHTYISLAANKIYESYPKELFLSALKKLASSVGNSVEVILEYYLDATKDVDLPSF
ncbi:tyrosine-type recombinase/integrase [Dapis sp. BLCC M172]|uniref:tyrosine-type recombinase/integrase n=1 Tax=Dapis sp. BLCC M172 TaxID=2975281 RepID=UPI003CEB9571